MGDQQNRSPLPKSADRVEQRVLGSSVEGCGWFVEYDHLGIVQYGTRNLDHLFFGRAKRAHGRRWRDIEVERLQELLGQQLADEDVTAETTKQPRSGDEIMLAAWTTVARVLLNLDEFITRE